MWAKLYVMDERFESRFFPGNRLTAPGRFEQPLESSWSVVLEFKKPSDEEEFFWGVVYFLFDEAPHEVLFEGNEFVFLDGYIPVIRVVISHPFEDSTTE